MHHTNVRCGGRPSASARGLAATVALSLPLTLAGLTLATPEPALAAPGDSLQGTDYDRANYGGFLAESIRTCRTVVRSPDPTGCGRRTI